MKTIVGHYPLGGRVQISVCIVHISSPVLMNKDRSFNQAIMIRLSQ